MGNRLIFLYQHNSLNEVVTEKVRRADYWISLYKYVGSMCRQIRMCDNPRYDVDV